MNRECARDALTDVRNRAEEKLYPESIVYYDGKTKKYELDSWIRPGCVVRIWAGLAKNTSAVHLLFSAKVTDTTRMDHLCAEIVTFNPNGSGERRDFDFGYMYEGQKYGVAHEIHTYIGRIMSPDWVFIDKVKNQVKKPDKEFLRLIAIGKLSESVYNELKKFVESPDSTVQRVGDKENRHVYDIRHPDVKHYRALVPWFAEAVGGCHNCTSFIMKIFGNMVVCLNKFNLVIPGSCKTLPGGTVKECDKHGLLKSTKQTQPSHEVKKHKLTSDDVERDKNIKRQRRS